jgi:uncharacterized protein (TIGR02266 family)
METPMPLVMPMVKIRVKCPDVDSFIDKYRADVNASGIFVRTRSPLAAGTLISFDFRLADGSCLFRGRGVVAWARADEKLAPLLDAGMMLSFDELRDGTRENFERALARKRVMDEAADTVPTLVRTFSGAARPLPMTTKLTADQVEELRSRMRAQMAAEGNLPAAPTELASEAASAVVPALVPAEPRERIEAKPVPAPLAKVLVLRPEPAPLREEDPPAVVEAKSSPCADLTALVERPPARHRPARRRSARLIGLGIAGGTLAIVSFALVRLDLAHRILAWLAGA